MKCEACGGQGWLIFTVSGSLYYDDGTLVVQKCDECEKFKSDKGARVVAGRAGLKMGHWGVVSPEEARRWMALYPNKGIKPKEVK